MKCHCVLQYNVQGIYDSGKITAAARVSVSIDTHAHVPGEFDLLEIWV